MLELVGVGMPGLDALLTAGAILLGAPYAVRHSPRRRIELDEEPPDARPDVVRVWDDLIGCEEGGLLPGAFLIDGQEVKQGTAYTIQLVGGRQHTGTAVGQKQLIASAYASRMGTTADCVEVEPALSNRLDQARLLILRANPLVQPQTWDGPTLGLHTGGTAVCARYSDQLPGRVQFFELGSGAINLILAGVPGSGKTTLVTWLLAESAHAMFTDITGRTRPLMQTVFADGKRGQSIPEAVDSPGIGWAATWPQECARAILCFREAMYARQRYLGRLRWTDARGRERRGMAYFDPVVACLPYMQLVIEEWPKLREDYPWLVSVVHEIGKIGRSLGMRIVLVAQSITGDEIGSTELRNVASGGAIVCRTNDRTTSGMAFAGQLEVDPSSLPIEMQGACFIKGPDVRATMARGLLVEDPFGWLSTSPEWEFGEVDVEAMGEGLSLAPARREFYEEHGKDPDEAPELWAPILAEHRGEPVKKVLMQLLGLADDGEGALPPVPPGGETSGEESPLDELVVRAVHAGKGELVSRAEVIEFVSAEGDRDWSARSIQDALSRLIDAGRIAKPKHGKYRPVTATTAA